MKTPLLPTDFELSDVIGSWLLVSQLHSWMILVRISEPGKTSEYYKRQLIKRMQTDLESRVNRMGVSGRNSFRNCLEFTSSSL